MEYAHGIQTSGENLLNIINDIIDVSKIESGKLVLENIDFNLHSVIHEIAGLYAHEAHEKGLEVILNIDPDLPQMFCGDPTRIKQIFANLINNALKFTSEGYILIHLHQGKRDLDRSEIICSVQDTGIGVTKDKQSKIFEKFSQAEESTTGQFGGTGLGLTIVSEIISLMGGTIDVTSEIGEGSTFKFNMFLSNTRKLYDSISIVKPNSDMKIQTLLVEDCETSLCILVKILEKQGIECTPAKSGEEALVILEKSNIIFDICITDYILGGMNGGDLVQKIRTEKLYDSMALVIVSGVSNVGSYSKFEKMGVNGFIKKPYLLHEILNVIYMLANAKMDKKKIPFITTNTATNISSDGDIILDDENLFGDLKVLAVEDMKMNMKIIQKVLEKFGVQCETAFNGLEAVEKVKEQEFDIIFMDCQMPEMDGFTATKEIRKLEVKEKRSPATIIALTADAMIGDREKCLGVGMNDYINKPFKHTDIGDALKKWTDSKTIL